MPLKTPKIHHCLFVFFILIAFAAPFGFLYAVNQETDMIENTATEGAGSSFWKRVGGGYGFFKKELPANPSAVLGAATGEYARLAPLPDPPSSVVTKTGLAGYLQTLFWVAIIAAGVLAVLMITIGGLRYMASEAFGEKQAAKNQITMAIAGFILAISSVLILETINPNLLKFNLTLEDIKPFTVPDEVRRAGSIAGCTNLATAPIDGCLWQEMGGGGSYTCQRTVYESNVIDSVNWITGTDSHCFDPKPDNKSRCCLYIPPKNGCSGIGQFDSKLKECMWSTEANLTGDDCSVERGMPAGFREGKDTDCGDAEPADVGINCCVK